MQVAAVALSNTVALICGGQDTSGNNYAQCYKYSSVLDAWTQVSPLTGIRMGGRMVTYHGELHSMTHMVQLQDWCTLWAVSALTGHH